MSCIEIVRQIRKVIGFRPFVVLFSFGGAETRSDHFTCAPVVSASDTASISATMVQ